MNESSDQQPEPIHAENEALHEEWLPLHEAAARLNISPRAVQMRAEKGKIRRDRQQGRVVFAVPIRTPVHEVVHEESEGLHAENEAPRPDFVKHLEAEVTFLREQLKQRDVAESELRRLMLADKHELNTLREQVKLLAAAPEEAPVQDAPPPPQETRSTTEEVSTGNNAPAPPKRRWIDRLLGR